MAFNPEDLAYTVAQNFSAPEDRCCDYCAGQTYCGDEDDWAVEQLQKALQAAYDQGVSDTKHQLVTEGL